MIFSRIVLWLSVVLCLPSYAQTGPSDTERDRLTFAELMAEEAAQVSSVHNGYFMPVGSVAAAKHVLSATLIIPETEGWSFGTFPGASVQMFTSGDRLIPVNRDIIRAGNPFGWNITFSPGRTWSESGDKGLSRASFPFVLTKKWPESAHNGLATFLFDDETASPLVVQFSGKFSDMDTWVRLPFSLIRGKVKDRDRLEAEYLLEMEQRLPTRSLTELAEKFGSRGREALRLWPESENESVSGVHIKGILWGNKGVVGSNKTNTKDKRLIFMLPQDFDCFGRSLWINLLFKANIEFDRCIKAVGCSRTLPAFQCGGSDVFIEKIISSGRRLFQSRDVICIIPGRRNI